MTHTSREYAEALYALAMEEGKAEEYAEALALCEKELGDSPAFRQLLASPAISREERMNALSAAFEGRVPLSLLTLMRLMVFRGHARELLSMIESYRELARESRGESTAVVRSAVELTPEQKEKLREKLEKRFGRKMVLECEVDPALLGGIRVETDGRVLDGTLAARLKEIKEVMES